MVNDEDSATLSGSFESMAAKLKGAFDGLVAAVGGTVPVMANMAAMLKSVEADFGEAELLDDASAKLKALAAEESATAIALKLQYTASQYTNAQAKAKQLIKWAIEAKIDTQRLIVPDVAHDIDSPAAKKAHANAGSFYEAISGHIGERPVFEDDTTTMCATCAGLKKVADCLWPDGTCHSCAGLYPKPAMVPAPAPKAKPLLMVPAAQFIYGGTAPHGKYTSGPASTAAWASVPVTPVQQTVPPKARHEDEFLPPLAEGRKKRLITLEE